MHRQRVIVVSVGFLFLAAACGRTVASPTTSVSIPATTVASVVNSTVPPTTSSSTTTQPTTTTSTIPPKGTLVIHSTGDVALDPGYVWTLKTEGYDYAWTGLEGLFVDDDLTVINLECSASNLGTRVPKAFNFRCDPDSLPIAFANGIDVANLANNHGLDYGAEALLDSVVNLEAAGIRSVGAGANALEAFAPALVEVNGWTIAILGLSTRYHRSDWVATNDRPGIADGNDIDAVVEAVAAANQLADLVIVTIHWGRELDTTPRSDDIERAEMMVAAGADIIFGHHQHRLGPLGWVGEAPVAWGLGNFVWPRITASSARTAIAHVVVQPDGSIGACLIPADIVMTGHPSFTGDTPGTCELLFPPEEGAGESE